MAETINEVGSLGLMAIEIALAFKLIIRVTTYAIDSFANARECNAIVRSDDDDNSSFPWSWNSS